MSRPYHITLSPHELLAKAREITGINIVDTDAIEPLTKILGFYEEDINLTERSAAFAQKNLIRLLCNRLRLERDFAAHPEIAEQKIEAPVVVIGLPRTGSTKTQKLFSSSGDFNWMPLWMALNPCSYSGIPGEDTKARIADTDDYVDYINSAAPGLTRMHEFPTHEPEEEQPAMAHCLISPIWGASASMRWMQWLAEEDTIDKQLAYLRRVLQYLQWQGLADESKPWLLKYPPYTAHEPKVLKYFPDARWVMTHRHPKDVLGSSVSMATEANRVITDDEIDPVPFVSSAYFQVDQHMQNRRDLKLDICDIYFKELVESVGTVAEKVYAAVGMELSPESKQRMLNWDASNPQHAKGAHKYSLADFGLTDEKVEEQYAGYLAFARKQFPQYGF